MCYTGSANMFRGILRRFFRALLSVCESKHLECQMCLSQGETIIKHFTLLMQCIVRTQSSHILSEWKSDSTEHIRTLRWLRTKSKICRSNQQRQSYLMQITFNPTSSNPLCKRGQCKCQKSQGSLQGQSGSPESPLLQPLDFFYTKVLSDLL